MAPVLHERVLPVRGFRNQRQIGLIIDKGTKALSKNRMIIDGQNADRCGGNVHASCLVMRCGFPLQSLYQGSRLRGITVTGYTPPTWLRAKIFRRTPPLSRVSISWGYALHKPRLVQRVHERSFG